MRVKKIYSFKVWFSLLAVLSVTWSVQSAASSSEKVRIGVEGSITARCTLNGSHATDTRTMTIEDIAVGNFEYGYNIDCNAPFKYSVESQNGGLALNGAPNATARLPYVLSVHIPTDDLTINDHCPSETLKAGQITCRFQDSRNGIAIDGRATLSLAWTPPSSGQLPAGTYSDTITFVVGVRQ